MHVELNIMTDEKKLEFASQLQAEINIDSIEQEDIYNLMNHHTFKTKIAVEKAVKAMAYIRLRDFEKYTRVDAFKKVFPDRWKEGDTDKAIGARARRLESTDIYKKIILEMEMNFYSIFAIEQVHVTNEALRRAYDKNISEKYQFEYLKLFLETTKKPTEAKSKYEVDVNINQDGQSIADLDAKLSYISNKLDGATQAEIMEAILLEDKSDDS